MFAIRSHAGFVSCDVTSDESYSFVTLEDDCSVASRGCADLQALQRDREEPVVARFSVTKARELWEIRCSRGSVAAGDAPTTSLLHRRSAGQLHRSSATANNYAVSKVACVYKLATYINQCIEIGTQKSHDYINCTTGQLRVKIDWHFERVAKRVGTHYSVVYLLLIHRR